MSPDDTSSDIPRAAGDSDITTDKLSARVQKEQRNTSSSTRVRDIKQFRTQHMPSMQVPKSNADALFSRLQSFLSHFGKLHDASTFDELLKIAMTLAGSLLGIRYQQVLQRNAQGKFVPVKSTGSLPKDQMADDFGDVVKWSMEGRQVLFYDLEEQKAGDAQTLGILPISYEPTMQSALALWIAEPVAEMNVLQVEMLQTLQRDLAARASALMQADRYMRLTTLFDNIIESVPHAIIAIGGNDQVMAINSNAEFLFNLQRIFVIDEDFHLGLPESLVTTFDEMISATLLGSTETDQELDLDLGGGVKVSVGISLSFLKDSKGNPLGYLFLCRDMSLSREVQKLRELDQMKSEFVNTVSHELKTPLTAILGGLEVLEDDLDTLPEDTREMIGIVNAGAHRLRDLIFDLLDASRLETGKVKLREELVDIREVISESLEVQHPHPTHTITIEVDDDVPPVVMDQAKILQCVTNYVSNAIKYSPEGGTITIRAKRNNESRLLTVSVSDQGLGIGPQHLEKVWEKFFRVDASYTSQIEGTGLGLVIVRRIVELHGGTTWVESELGKGSTFFLTLPLRTTMG